MSFPLQSNTGKNEEKNITEKLKQNYNGIKRRFLEMIEELKMRRMNDKDTEIKINALLAEKFELKRNKEEEILSLKKEVENLKRENLHTQKEFEEKIKIQNEDKNLQSLSISSNSQGIKTLKDEILSLQLTKYSLEKKIKDQEHQLHSETRGREDVVKRISEYEEFCVRVNLQVEELSSRVKYLSDLVVKTESIHQNLVEAVNHNRCLSMKYDNTIEKLRKELIICRANQAEVLQEK